MRNVNFEHVIHLANWLLKISAECSLCARQVCWPVNAEPNEFALLI